MTLAVLLDIDGTLTPARKNLRREMAEALINLKIPFYVAAGSDLPLLEHQFFEPLFEFGCRRDFEAFTSNGSAHFACRFSRGYEIKPVGKPFRFEEYLGTEDYQLVTRVLTAALARFPLPDSQGIVGKHIIDRGSMVNFAPIGRPAGALSEAARRAREQFTAFDRQGDYRAKVRDYLNQELRALRDQKDLLIMYGGETSFDIVIRGQDKTRAARTVLENGAERIVFIGDALHNNGNDSVIQAMHDEWDEADGACPVEPISVAGWHETLEVFRQRGWLANLPNS